MKRSKKSRKHLRGAPRELLVLGRDCMDSDLTKIEKMIKEALKNGNGNGWEKWSKLITSSIERFEREIERIKEKQEENEGLRHKAELNSINADASLTEKIAELDKKVTALNTKFTTYMAVASFIASVVTGVLLVLLKYLLG